MFKVLSQKVETGFELSAPDIEKLFIDAASGWKKIVMDEPETQPLAKRSVYFMANTLEDLLVKWLGELNYFLNVHDWILHEVQTIKISNQDSQWKLQADLTGQGIISSVHKFKSEIKAVKYNHMEIIKDGEQYKTHIIFDI